MKQQVLTIFVLLSTILTSCGGNSTTSTSDAEFTVIAYVLTAELAPFIEVSDEVTWRVELEFIINDILCLLFMVAERYRFDLMEFVKLKMDYNRSRPFKHGGKKY